MSHSTGGAGHGASAVLERPEQFVDQQSKASRPTTSTASTNKNSTQSGNPLTVIAVSFLLFLALVSLPWLLDNIQDGKGSHKNETKASSTTKSVDPTSHEENTPAQDRFGAPRLGTEPSSSHSLDSFRSAINSATTRFNNSPDSPPDQQGDTGSEASSYKALESSIPVHSDYAHQAMIPTGLAPNHTSSFTHQQQRQLSPALQAPAEAMANLLSGKDVPLDSYYASIYGTAPPGASNGNAPPLDVSSPRSARRSKGVFEAHQMFVMR